MKKFTLLIVMLTIGWFTTVLAFEENAKAETLIIPLDGNTLTREGEEIIEMIGFRDSKRPDMEFFLIHPQKYPEIYCLAKNVFFEASIDSNAGMAAVADVTLNRVKDNRYPNSVCDVVHQAVMKESWKTKQHPELDDSERKYIPARNKCQFSWFCDGKSDDIPIGSENWVKAQMISWEMVSDGKFRGITEGSTHYHATYVNPSWNKMKNLDLVGRIGLHIFYRWN